MVRKIGILTSGGDAPGMNAAIRAVTRIALNNGVDVVGIRNAYMKAICSTWIREVFQTSYLEVVLL